MAVELRLLDAAGNYSEILPDWADLTFSQDLLDPGILSFTYPTPKPNCPAITNPTAVCTCQGRNAHLLVHGVQMCVLLDGVEPLNARFYYNEGTGSRIVESDGSTATFKASSSLERFGTFAFGPAFTSQDSAPTDPYYVFTNKFPGEIAITAINNAMARCNQKTTGVNWLTHPITSFTTTKDSFGTNWPQAIDVTFEPGSTVREVIEWLTENGWAEPSFKGRSFQLFQPSTNGTDRSIGSNPVVLLNGRDFTEASYQTASNELVNALLVLGDNNKCSWRLNQASIDKYGYREGILKVSGVSTVAHLSTIGDWYLTTHKDPRWAYSYAVSAMYLEQSTAAPLRRPFLDYQVGDSILILDGVATFSTRLRLLSATWASARAASVQLTVNDWFAEAEVEMARRMRQAGIS